MDYAPARWPRLVFGLLACVIAVVLLAGAFWHPGRERYFQHVANSCRETHQLARIPWRGVPTFDARVQRFEARGAQQIAALNCINRWAGVIIGDRVSADVVRPTLEATVTGQHLAPERREVYYTYLVPAD